MIKDTHNFAKITQIDYDITELAIFASALPLSTAQKLFQEMKDNDVKKLIQEMGKLTKCSRERVNEVLRKFEKILSEEDEFIFDKNKGREFIIGTLGEDRAKQILGQIVEVGTFKGLESLELVDVRTLSNFLINEHPQTIALVMAHLDTEKRTSVLRRLPEGLQAEVVLRVANLDYVSPEMISQLDDILKTELSTLGTMEDSQLGGIESIAETLNQMDINTERNIMARIEEKDPVLAEEIRKLMFTFEDIILIDNKGIQELLKEVDNRTLLISLKGCKEELLQKFTSNISERAKGMFIDDMRALGQIRKTDQEKAQQDVISVIKRLESTGKLIINRKGDDIFV